MCGALGGLVIQAIAFYGNIAAWQAARRAALARPRRRKPLPSLREHVDLPADSLVALTRLGLGALAGALFHTQIIGMTAAVAVGASAPALLRQLGALPQVQQGFQEPQPGEPRPAPPSPTTTEGPSPRPTAVESPSLRPAAVESPSLRPATAEGPSLAPGEVPAE